MKHIQKVHVKHILVKELRIDLCVQQIRADTRHVADVGQASSTSVGMGAKQNVIGAASYL